jgi:hypothetical protein
VKKFLLKSFEEPVWHTHGAQMPCSTAKKDAEVEIFSSSFACLREQSRYARASLLLAR